VPVVTAFSTDLHEFFSTLAPPRARPPSRISSASEIALTFCVAHWPSRRTVTIRQREEFIEAMADINDRHTVGAKVTHDGKETFDIMLCEHRGGFVKD
jgi:hypothetical protein